MIRYLHSRVYYENERGNIFAGKQNTKKTTEHKIGKVTYLVSSAPSEKASDTIDKKIAKMIRKEVMQNAEKASV